MAQSVMTNAKTKMNATIESYQKELASIRAGRANAALLDRINVEYYGAPTPLNQMASISVPEPRLLVIQPYDKTIITEIEKAILRSDLGITPSNDGSLIRIAVPALTEERRKELVKNIKKVSEDAKVSVRNVRRDSNDELKKLEKSSEITEDELRTFTDDVQKITDDFIKQIDEITKQKENEIMEV